MPFEFKAVSAYYLSLYVLLSGSENGLNTFPLANKLAKGEKLALVLIYLNRFTIDYTSVMEIS